VTNGNSAVRIGLIGLGSMGRNHLRVLSMLNSVSLEFVHDIDAARARQLAAAHGVAAADDLEAALSKVEAVVICSPTVHHAEHARLAARHVPNVFVEKPLADTLAAARSLAELASQAKLNLQVGFIERFNPAVQLLKTILGKSERIVNVDFTRTNRLSARITDVDVVADLMIHDIDLALHLNGPVNGVSATGVRGSGMIDFASVTLSHRNGCFSRVLASRITEKKIRAIHATCMDMYVDCDLLRKEIVISRQSQIRNVAGEPYTITATEDTVAVAPEEALLLELRAFIAGCRGERRPEVPDAAAGLAAMEICEKIRGSIAA
jgi:predicted dehydrogenase